MPTATWMQAEEWDEMKRTTCIKEKRRNTTSEDPAVNHPSVLGAGRDIIKEAAVGLLLVVRRGSRRTMGLRFPAAEGRTSFELGETRLWIVLFTTKEGFASPNTGLAREISCCCKGLT
jgi:hypothetical protein